MEASSSLELPPSAVAFFVTLLETLLVPVSNFLFHTLLLLDLSADTTPSPKVTQIQGAFYTGKKYQISPKVDLTERMGMNSRGHSSFCYPQMIREAELGV